MPLDRKLEDLEVSHFALIYIDQNGVLRHEVSQSLMDSRDTIFTPRVKDEFLRAITKSTDLVPPLFLCDSLASAQIPSRQTVIEHVFCLAQIGYDRLITNSRSTKGHMQDLMNPGPPIQSEKRSQHHNEPSSKRTRISSNQEAFISITDKGFLRQYYEKIWQNFQQTNCRVLAKAYVKLIEPRKQVTYPYNGRKIIAGKTHQLDPNETKPPWWPTGVSHREPDHLPKAERIRLLVYILCEMRTSHGITAHKLKAAEQHIRTQIFPTERLGLLDEVYRVREEEEKFQDGLIDGKARIPISRSNVPGSTEEIIRPGKRNQKELPVDKSPTSKKAKPKQVSSRGGSSSETNKPQPVLETCMDHPPNPHSTTHGPIWCIQQDLSIYHSYSPGSASLSPQAMIECQHSGSAVPTTTHPIALDFSETCSDIDRSSWFQNGLDPGHLVPEAFEESMENCGLFYN